MAVIVKLGLLEHRGKVRTEGGVFGVEPADGGWYTVGGPASEGVGRVTYSEPRDTLRIERPGISLAVVFQPEPKATTFEFRGHTFEVGSMDFGSILVVEGGRAVVRGHVTISGVRLLSVAPELLPIEREFAFGLALRGAAQEEDFWQAEHVYTEWQRDRLEGAVLREGEHARHEDG